MQLMVLEISAAAVLARDYQEKCNLSGSFHHITSLALCLLLAVLHPVGMCENNRSIFPTYSLNENYTCSQSVNHFCAPSGL